MRLYSVRFSVLVYSLFLFFMGGISFAKPGDYLVYSLDPMKDSSLKCCCCGDAFSKTYYPRLCFLKYENDGNMKTTFEEAKKFNLKKAEEIKSKFFDDIKTGDYCSVVNKFKKALAEMKGLFCSHCMEVAFEVAGIFRWKEFLAPGLEFRTDNGKILANCYFCNDKLDRYNHVDHFCGKCGVYSYCSGWCYHRDKDSCPVCRKAIKPIKRRIPYLLNGNAQKTNNDGTKVKIDMNCGVYSSISEIFDYKGMKFVIYYCFVKKEMWFKHGTELSNEEKEGYYEIPKVNNKFHFVCSLKVPDDYNGDIYKDFEFMKKSEEVYEKHYEKVKNYYSEW